jgi:hypothetical protein
VDWNTPGRHIRIYTTLAPSAETEEASEAIHHR